MKDASSTLYGKPLPCCCCCCSRCLKKHARKLQPTYRDVIRGEQAAQVLHQNHASHRLRLASTIEIPAAGPVLVLVYNAFYTARALSKARRLDKRFPQKPHSAKGLCVRLVCRNLSHLSPVTVPADLTEYRGVAHVLDKSRSRRWTSLCQSDCCLHGSHRQYGTQSRSEQMQHQVASEVPVRREAQVLASVTAHLVFLNRVRRACERNACVCFEFARECLVSAGCAPVFSCVCSKKYS